jgi:two-component system phosphate regulon sensor histidine kinase PhoR
MAKTVNKVYIILQAKPALGTGLKPAPTSKNLKMPKNKQANSTRSRDWSHFLIQKTPGAVITADTQARITEFNPAAERMTGFSRAETLGRVAGEILHFQGGEVNFPLSRVWEGKLEVTDELILHSRSGQEVPVMISSFALRDEHGAIYGGAVIIRDLTLVKRLETERRHLVNMFAHDLKTPVVGIAGLTRRLLQGKLGELAPAQINYLQTVDRELHRLEELITHFLDFARLDLRIMTPQPQDLDVGGECQEVLTLLQPLAEAKEITLLINLPPEIPTLKADPYLFRRVLENLIGNAIKYSPSGSTVWLEAQIEDPAVRFAVKDQGPGISPDDLFHLFESFYRGQGVADIPGFGLGLATVKRIIDAHGGRIWVDTTPGHGSSFYFTIPLETPNTPSK